MTLELDDPRHGTDAGYRHHRCRCDLCRRANADYSAANRRRRGYTHRSRADRDDPYDSTDPAGVFGHPAWMATAPCVGLTSLFFPTKGGPGSGSAARAKAVCATCPLRAECLDYALEHSIRHGVWGGTTERERRRIRKVRVEAAA